MDYSKQIIDFVIPWVDGSDPNWLAKKQRYCPDAGTDSSAIRYRDWGTLRYWFRGVEKFAPWVHHVWLVTDNQKPEWLNTEHEKLTLVDHRDYIPEEYLPTFSANPIELNLHRIQGLAQQFVYFNDDTFLCRPAAPALFFRNGLPCDDAILSPIFMDGGNGFPKVCANDMNVINRHFEKKTVMRDHWFKWFSPKYGRSLLKTILLLPWGRFPGFFNDHLPVPFLKSTFEELWSLEKDVLHEVSTHRFRDCSHDVNQWLMRYWQFCKGDFVPVSPNRGKYYGKVDEEVIRVLTSQKKAIICINDTEIVENFEESRCKLIDAFEQILPEQSSFELW